ncbi:MULTISPECIES: sigma-70 family RNA polymerase sigma factor [Methylobacterium]|jgi:RNA polymerase sigma-70 factor (ECF subfamily)|uniref:RNA polymerase sigma factor n=1 Tax=Methylobacterium radiotolerans (strain ATCC 27329 / DSM 1819 / JCM 2831 / NBRC 15690 / NCIMB 10815 / 0-1) TaxID=426355 RepID=B1LVJ2_METRJ|nr:MULTISPECIES: sigma-70 family RNA polymerase sigma factor [Methylobacterium]GAN52059.1 ECF subfamily RNA polymerase sigma-24 factor [Methylobacterium sp. ME121]ACB24073.1 RNA polymerase, sigma-24 subunit, ECF subfamily [Methylobacterium radiotolerans JCM 2831]KIU34750.1 RNA polymerase subunit sigma-70 [Methylobacterium radiotolerans]KTR98947.1 RNA polymerase subunit sigma-70 [Methylobacterium radiotolerans]KTS44528.1 RNA polymerase subunit sigma-70 [Methylobacterium radiotolerans]
MLELSLDADTIDAQGPRLPDSVQYHLGHLLAATYAQDNVEPTIADRFAELLRLLDGAFGRAQDGREKAFQASLLAMVPNLQRFARSLLRSHVGADDLLQNTLLRAWRSRASFAPGTNLEAWLFTIMRNQFYNEHRKRGREVQDEDGAQAERMVSLPEQGGHLDLSDVQAALDRLAPPMRQALVLVAIENLTYEETAAVMQCRIGTVKSRVWRARTQLAEMLGYTGLEVGSDDVMLAAAGPKGRKSTAVS